MKGTVMINGTIKCTITRKEAFEPNLNQRGYCARMDVMVMGWTAGEKVEQFYAVYFPEFMRRRMEHFLKPETKYCVIVFDAITVVQSQSGKQDAYIVLIANRIEM